MTIWILLFSSISFAQSDQLQELEYKIKYLGGDHPNCLDITAGIKGNKTGKTLLKFPEYVGNVAFSAKKGNVSYTPADNRKFLIQSEPNSDLKQPIRFV